MYFIYFISSIGSLYLNRQAITLLSGLGVKDIVFRRLQEEMLLKMGRMLFDDEAAAKALTSSKSQRTDINFNRVLESGVSLTTEPFFRGLLVDIYYTLISEFMFY